MFFYRVFYTTISEFNNTKLPFAQKKLILKQWQRKFCLWIGTILTEG